MEHRSRDIAKDEWKLFFDHTSRHYRGRTVDLFCRTKPGEVARAVAKNLPFIGCTLESDGANNASLVVIAGNASHDDEQLVSHTVRIPKRVWIRQEANGGDNAMGVESQDGSALIIEFATAH